MLGQGRPLYKPETKIGVKRAATITQTASLTRYKSMLPSVGVGSGAYG